MKFVSTILAVIVGLFVYNNLDTIVKFITNLVKTIQF